MGWVGDRRDAAVGMTIRQLAPCHPFVATQVPCCAAALAHGLVRCRCEVTSPSTAPSPQYHARRASVEGEGESEREKASVCGGSSMPVLAQTPPWVGTVVSVAILLSPVAIPHVSKSTRHLLKPRKCPRCLGVGNNLCCHCKGRGKQGGVFTGAPLRRCSVCDGRGRELCSPCEASGLSYHWLYQLPAIRGMK